ncbi:MAG TPA: hypothetical protein VMH61_03475 [Candidatus Acidoferrales bacterium]|nr:hypothetical protein [Candidatus Acidoferrales bacterium]
MRAPVPPRRDAWATGTLAFAIGFWALDLLVLKAGAPDLLDDTWEYGAAARTLLAGQGLRTPVIHPPLWTLHDAAGTVPVLVHGPLLPLVLAPLLALAGPRALDLVAVLAALFATLAARRLQRLGARRLSPEVGAAAAGLFTVSPLVLRAVHHDVALVCGAWLLTLALDQVFRTRPHAIRAGLALGLGALVRPEFVLATPLVALAARGGGGALLGTALVVVLPWLWHGAANAGAPLFNLSSYLLIGYWGAHPGIGVMRDFALPPRAWSATLRHALPQLPAKWIDFFPHALKRLLLSPTGGTGWLAPFGALVALQERPARAIAALSLGLALIPLGIMTVTLYDERYLTPFLPVIALGAARGAAEFAAWLPAWGRRPRTWIGLLVLLALPSSGPALHDGWREGVAARARLADERAGLVHAAASHRANALAFSDTPDFLAWTLDRPAVWVSRAEYLALPPATPGVAPPRDRPARSASDLVWFHEAEGRGPWTPATGAAPSPPDSVRGSH